MRFDDLKVEQLKKELCKLDLPTAGNKVELQKRLIDEIKWRDMDIGTYEFDEKEGMDVNTIATTSNIDLNAIFAAITDRITKLQETSKPNNKILLAEVQETSTGNNNKLLADVLDNNNINNQKLLDEVRAEFQSTSKANNELLLAEVKTEEQEISRASKERLQKISGTLNKRVDDIEEKLSGLEKDVDVKLNPLDARMKSFQLQVVPVRNIPENSSKIKTPS